MPKPPGREISIISDWGSGIKLSADEDGLPEKIGFFSRWTHFQFVAESTFVPSYSSFGQVHGNQKNL